jgi:cyclophilin family peptidyl-prolyl cis-trans isomerase/protein-disulfide isomerase
MQKSLTLLVLLAALVMSACQPTANSTPSLTAELIPTTTTAATAIVAVPVTTSEATSPDPVPTTAEVRDVAEGCTVVSQGNQPTPLSPFRAIDETDWAFGPETARVTIIEYSDFQCPDCALLTPVLNQLKEDFQDDLRIIFRHYPLSKHDKALLSAYAAEAAGVQEKFWEMHNQLFERQAEWSSLSLEAFRPWLLDLAAELGLDVNAFEADLDNADVHWRVQRDLDEAIIIPGTPTLAINGQYYGGPTDFVNFSAIVNLIKLEDIQFSECPPMTIDPGKQYRATLETEKGDIVIELLAEQAPIAVNNFVFLSENNWYDGVTFHRVLPGFVAQAGDPTGTGFGGPGYAFKNEIAPGLTFNDAGIVGMANAGADSNGSQFFITYAAQPQLDGGYTIFGRVIAGMDVLVELTPRDPAQDSGAAPGDVILDVTIEVK